MMFFSTLHVVLALLFSCNFGAAKDIAEDLAEDLVREDRIKVFLYAAPAYWREVAVDAYKDTCTTLTNNLIDGRVQSILIGGRDIVAVLQRTDDWYCSFYKNYDCSDNDSGMLTFADGVNNLQSVAWETKIHAFKCSIENEGYLDK